MRERNRPGPDESASVPRGGSRKKTATEQQSFDSENQSFHPHYSFLTGDFAQMKLGSEENLLQRLPLEVLLKILSYLDASSLICVSHVSKLFHRLANDDFVWRNIYASEFGSPEWKPKLAPPPSPATAAKEEPCSAGGWKKKFFRRMGEQDMDKWKKDLRTVCPHTSLPQQTEAVLRFSSRFPAVLWQVLGCSRAGSWLFSGRFPAVLRQVPGCSPAGSRLFSGRFPAVLRQVPGCSPAGSRLFSGRFPAVLRQVFGCSLAGSRLFSGRFPAVLWQVPGCSLAGSRLFSGRFPAVLWQVLGCSLAGSRLFSRRFSVFLRQDFCCSPGGSLSVFSGFPQLFCRNLKMSWELALVERSGQETRLDQSRATFFESSVVVCWSCSGLLHVHSICSIHVYGVRKEARRSCRSPRAAWRSLVLQRDTRSDPQTPVGADGLMEVLLLPDVLLGVWRSSSRVAFVMVSLHLHRLVERSLLGSPACPYSVPVDPPSADHSDPEFGLHGYTVHFVLHNANFKIILGHFRQLSCGSVEKQRRLLELRFISRTDLSEHRLLPGGIRLLWKCGELQGAVENCCFLTLTLLDIHQKPFWCVSAPVTARMSKAESSYYSGDHFLMEYQHADGEVEMKLVWLKEQKQFLVHSLVVCVAVDKVNQHFSREY